MPDSLDPNSILASVRVPEMRMPAFLEVRNPLVVNAQANLASEFYERISKWISQFDEELDQQHEVGVRLVSFGQTFVFHLEQLGYWNPSLISFSGKTDSGDPVELIQHVSQISVLLTKMPRKDITKPKRAIGFSAEDSNT